MAKADNPKHNPLARRRNRPRYIGGVLIPPDILAEAQRRRIELLRKEMAQQVRYRLPRWLRLWLKIKNVITNAWTKTQKE